MAKRKQRPKPQPLVAPPPARVPAYRDVASGATAYSELPREVLVAWVTLAILAIAVLLLYLRALNAPLIFDDWPAIKDNPSLLQLWPLAGTDEHPGPLNPPKNSPTAGRPLPNLTLAINYLFGELSPLGYHVFNLIVHVLSAALLASIARRTLELPYFRGRFDHSALPLSVLIALVWALHPLQTEAVIYITQRTELLVGFFYFATLYTSIRYWSAAPEKTRRKWLVLAALSCLCGAASKEVIVTAPVVVLLYERAFLAGSFREALRRSWPLYAALALSWLLLLWLNIDMPRGGSVGFNHGMPAYVWWFTQSQVLWIYFKLVFWPWPLVIRYGMPYLGSVGVAWPWLLATASLAVVTGYLLWRNRAAGFLLACVWLVLSPTMFVPILTEVAAERRMYLPLAALTGLVIIGGYLLLERLLGRVAAVVGGATVLAVTIALAVVGFVRLGDYLDEVALWRDAVAHQPGDPVLHNNFSETLIRYNDAPAAIEQAEIAVRLNPNYAEAHKNLGEGLYMVGRASDAAAHFEQAIRLKPNFHEPYNNLGVMAIAENRVPEAVGYFERALDVKPDDYVARTNLADAQWSLGRKSEAIANFKKVLDQHPDYPSVHTIFAFALYGEGKVLPAIEHFQEAVRLKPNDVGSRDNLGVALLSANRTLEAANQFEQAIKHQPDDVRAWTNLARARARLHQFPEAIQYAEKALKLAQDQGLSDRVKKIEASLEAYRLGQEPAETSSPDLKPSEAELDATPPASPK